MTVVTVGSFHGFTKNLFYHCIYHSNFNFAGGPLLVFFTCKCINFTEATSFRYFLYFTNILRGGGGNGGDGGGGDGGRILEAGLTQGKAGRDEIIP